MDIEEKGAIALIVVWALAILANLLVLGVIIWAVVKLVQHFTS